MRFLFVGSKSISKRLPQPDNTQKSFENANPLEEFCIILAEVLELEIHTFQTVSIGGTKIVCVIDLKIFYLIHLSGFRQGKCDHILVSCLFRAR